MEAVKNQAAEIQKLTGGEEHNFFGYYDVQAWDYQDKYHLCHKVEFMDRMPEPEDVARLGFVDRDTGAFTLLDTTTAWCFQQGAFLQWNPAGSSREVFYNIREGETFKCRIKNIETLEARELERVSPVLLPTAVGRSASISAACTISGRATAISFDSNHENHRHIYTMDLKQVMGFLETKD